MLSKAASSTIPINLLKRGRNGGQFKAVSPLFSYYSSISTPPTKDINNNIDIIKNQRYYSTYTPPPNNKYHGTPVYNDINIDANDISNAAIARNSDPEAVFVVTGASRNVYDMNSSVQFEVCDSDTSFEHSLPYLIVFVNYMY